MQQVPGLRRSRWRADLADTTATATIRSVATVAVSRPGHVNTCAAAETGFWPVNPLHASTAKIP